MPEGPRLRLIAALSDYIESYTGDGGRSARGTAPGVETAQQLLGELQGAEEGPMTPGQRAARSKGGSMDGAANRARELLSGA